MTRQRRRRRACRHVPRLAQRGRPWGGCLGGIAPSDAEGATRRQRPRRRGARRGHLVHASEPMPAGALVSFFACGVRIVFWRCCAVRVAGSRARRGLDRSAGQLVPIWTNQKTAARNGRKFLAAISRRSRWEASPSHTLPGAGCTQKQVKICIPGPHFIGCTLERVKICSPGPLP